MNLSADPAKIKRSFEKIKQPFKSNIGKAQQLLWRGEPHSRRAAKVLSVELGGLFATTNAVSDTQSGNETNDSRDQFEPHRPRPQLRGCCPTSDTGLVAALPAFPKTISGAIGLCEFLAATFTLRNGGIAPLAGVVGAVRTRGARSSTTSGKTKLRNNQRKADDQKKTRL
jgi:hypothetical protein